LFIFQLLRGMTCGVWVAEQFRRWEEFPDAAIANKLGACGKVEKDFVSWGHTW
jgi:hypothetical protein